MNSQKIRLLLEYLLVLCMILEFNTPYMFSPVLKRVIQIFPIVFLLVLLVMANYSIKRNTNTHVFIYLAGALFPMLILEEHSYLAYIIRFVVLLPLLWMYLNIRKEAGLEAYCSLFFKFANLVVVIAAVSVFMWIYCSILQAVPPTGYVPYEWVLGKDFIPTYWGIYFETQTIIAFGERIYRNSGIFNEGPMFNMVLCTAFIIEYFIRPNKSNIRLGILGTAILTTLTTTGQFFLLGIGLWIIYSRINRRHRIILVTLVPVLLYVGYVVGNKLFDSKLETGSGSVDSRSLDIDDCINAGMEHPVFGIGLVLKEGDGTVNGRVIGRSNSLFAVFARGGIYTLILYVGALVIIPYLYYRKYNEPRWFYAMICYFLIFTITISFLKYLTFLFIAWGLSNLNLKRWMISKPKAMPKKFQ